MATTDFHVPPAKSALINRHRHDDDHIKNCKTLSEPGYLRPKEHNVHHILSVSCLADKNLGDDESFILKCLRATEWDINNARNQIGLPLKVVYFNYTSGKHRKEEREKSKEWNLLPCHQVDHTPGYLDEVKTRIQKDLHDLLLKARKEERCEKVEGRPIARQLNRISDDFRKHLKTRGRRSGKKGGERGTLHCLEHRDEYPDTWFLPFSMVEDPAKRHAPTNNKGKLLALEDIFEIAPSKQK